MPDEDLPMHDDVTGFGPDDEALARELAGLGPLMRRLQAAEAEEPDPAFVQGLRARLAGEDAQPDPAFARDLRARLLDESSRRPRPIEQARRRTSPWAGLAVALLAATLLLVALLRTLPGLQPGHNTAHDVASGVHVPIPGVADLTRGFPLPPGVGGGGGGGVMLRSFAISTTLDEPSNPPYSGHVALTGIPHLHQEATVQAYRLAGPLGSARLAALARAQGIRSAVTRMTSGGVAWTVAADGGYTLSGAPLHSLAVSTATGELIYHDVRYNNVPTRGRLTRAGAIAAARAWLARLGWPAQRMPLQALAPPTPNGGPVWTVTLGWAGVGTANTSAAILTMAADGHVSEARLWPPVAHSYTLGARDVSSAWQSVRAGKAPLAVTIAPNVYGVPGRAAGTLARVDVVQALTRGKGGGLYLVPAYRFAGRGRLGLTHEYQPGADQADRAVVPMSWYALAPAQAR